MTSPIEQTTEKVRQASGPIQAILEEVGRVIVGQHAMLDRLLIGLLSNGHVLLEGVPGLAKTLAVSSFARALDASFHRIQFTPDLLPADLVGTLIFNPRSAEFSVRKGPVFAQIVLADEVNRAPAKVQSALLEAMQERRVTIGDETHDLPEPFLVLATQNPIEQEGTYPLPEAQVDRFMLKCVVGYPSRKEERAILERMATTAEPPTTRPVVSPRQVLDARAVVDEIYVDDRIKDYIVDLVTATRDPERAGLADLVPLIRYGASPRATIGLTLASKAAAFLAGRGFVTPQDVKHVALDVLRHRVIISYEAEAEEKTSDDVVRAVLDRVSVP